MTHDLPWRPCLVVRLLLRPWPLVAASDMDPVAMAIFFPDKDGMGQGLDADGRRTLLVTARCKDVDGVGLGITALGKDDQSEHRSG